MVEKLNVDDSSRELAVDFNNEPIKKARKRKLYKIALRRIKNAAAFPFIFAMRTKGYDKKTAKWWLRSIYRDYRRSGPKDYLEIFWAHRHGFRINTVKSYGINKDNYKDYMAEKDYYYISDINGIYKKWVSDKVSYRNILEPFSEHLPKQYYQFYKRDGKLLIIPLLDCQEGYKNTIYSVLRLIRREKSLDFVQCEGPKKVILSYRSKSYYINNKKATVREVAALINGATGYNVLTEHVKVNSFINQNSSEAFHKLRITTINKYGNKPLISNASILSITTQEDREIKGYGKYIAKAVDVATGTIKGTYALVEGIITDISRETKEGESKLQLPFWEEITQETIRLCRYIPEIEYLGIDVVITPNSFKFIAFNNFPKYPRLVNFDKEIVEFLNYKVEEKKNKYRSFKANYEQGKKIVTNGFWKYRSAIFARKGYRPLTYRKWRRTLTTDLFSKNGISLKEKLWAYNHGFLSYRLPQYGITKDNYRQFISDYDFRWLRHINSKYRVWLEDKITLKYLLPEYKAFFPEYYYHIAYRAGERCIIPMMDCPKDLEDNFDSILKLIRDKGTIAFKPHSGSLGRGFYRCSYDKGKYYLNFKEASEEEIIEILSDEKSQYLITEYIVQHKKLSKIYSASVNTVRMIVFKKDGINPEIGNAYIRIGSKKTGTVDNVSAGGLVATIDIETGRIYNGRSIDNNKIEPIRCHPDTGTKLEGILPNWDIIKTNVLNIARELKQIEYFGFDVAITENGFKLPEINRSPDYPKIENYTSLTNDYMLYKVKNRRMRYGIPEE